MQAGTEGKPAMAIDVILIFDIGKTNKKVLLIDKDLNIRSEDESCFEEILDDDGFACDDIVRIENWIDRTTGKFLKDPAFTVKAINFTTYGATLMYVDKSGHRLTPVYNYLKPMPEGIPEALYKRWGGIEEFSRKTASPALGMLNSGLQALWLKKQKPEVFSRVQHIMHFPQYLSCKLTGKIASEHTSIGCHTGMWDFDRMQYHDWVKDEGLNLTDPVPVNRVYSGGIAGFHVPVGVGIHDSSSSLVPYLMSSDKDFILVSTGTWCISMNPFNHTPLTAEQLQQDCLAYMSMEQKPVKSSRLFLGHIHDVNLQRLNEFFGMDQNAYKKVAPDDDLIGKLIKNNGGRRVFFANGIPHDYIDIETDPVRFNNFSQAYHQLMLDLTDLAAGAIKLVVAEGDQTENLYITGGFSKNQLFVRLIASRFSDKKVYTSEIANATSLGAALILWKCFGIDEEPRIDLGLSLVEPISSEK